MVISIETAIHSPRRGFIKLEDTVVVTQDGARVMAITAGDGTCVVA